MKYVYVIFIGFFVLNNCASTNPCTGTMEMGYFYNIRVMPDLQSPDAYIIRLSILIPTLTDRFALRNRIYCEADKIMQEKGYVAWVSTFEDYNKWTTNKSIVCLFFNTTDEYNTYQLLHEDR